MRRAAKPDYNEALCSPPRRSVSLRAAIGAHGSRPATIAMGRDLALRHSAPTRTGSRRRHAPPLSRYGRDRSRSIALAPERCRRLEARPADHRLCSLHQLRDRAAARVARGSHRTGSPDRVWGHPRGDRATIKEGSLAARCVLMPSARPSISAPAKTPAAASTERPLAKRLPSPRRAPNRRPRHDGTWRRQAPTRALL